MGENLDPRDFAETACIHGHFLAAKYLRLGRTLQLSYITWLRDPVDRIVSHYNYWRQSPGSTRITGLRRRLLEENWSLRRFALCEPMRNLYQSFLHPLALDDFLFVGITEHFEEDLTDFASDVLGAKLTSFVRNTSDSPVSPLDDALREEIMDHHAADMELYDQALALRQKRRSEATGSCTRR